jgi:hypothetical protein
VWAHIGRSRVSRCYRGRCANMRTARDSSFLHTVLGYVALGAIIRRGRCAICCGDALDGAPYVSDQSFGRWRGLGGNTILMFGWVMKQYRRLWRHKVFWCILASLLVIHLVCFYAILETFEELRLFWWVIAWPIELTIILFAIDWTIGRFGKHHHHATGRQG